MNNNCKVALVQAELHWEDPKTNRAHLEVLLEEAPSDTDLIVLPETFATGFMGRLSVRESMDGDSVNWLLEQSHRFQATLCGSLAIVEGNNTYNRFLWVTPDGDISTYDKRHLFSYAGEHKHYKAGSKRKTWQWGEWRVCPQICYDLRFPVWCRVRDDYDLLIFVANWPTPRVDAWTTLLTARAMENQCYVIGVNRVGVDGNGNDYPGQSAIYDPLGRPLTDLHDQEALLLADISLNRCHAIRSKFPFQQDADSFSL